MCSKKGTVSWPLHLLVCMSPPWSTPLPRMPPGALPALEYTSSSNVSTPQRTSHQDVPALEHVSRDLLGWLHSGAHFSLGCPHPAAHLSLGCRHPGANLPLGCSTRCDRGSTFDLSERNQDQALLSTNPVTQYKILTAKKSKYTRLC